MPTTGSDIVPELETVFHTGAMMQDMPSEFGGPGVLNMGSEKMYARSTRSSKKCAMSSTPRPIFQIGCDEASIGGVLEHPGTREYMREHGMQDGRELYRSTSIVWPRYRPKGKRTIVWQDCPLPRDNKDIICMVWHIDFNHGDTAGHHQGRLSHDQVTWTPSCGSPVKDLYGWRPFDDQIEPGKLAMGSQLVLWEANGSVAIPFLRQKMPARQQFTYSPEASLAIFPVRRRSGAYRCAARPSAHGHCCGGDGPKAKRRPVARGRRRRQHARLHIRQERANTAEDQRPRGKDPLHGHSGTGFQRRAALRRRAHRRFAVDRRSDHRCVAERGSCLSAGPAVRRHRQGPGRRLVADVPVAAVHAGCQGHGGWGRQPVRAVGEDREDGVRGRRHGPLCDRSAGHRRQPDLEKPIVLEKSGEVSVGFYDGLNKPRGLGWKQSFRKVDLIRRTSPRLTRSHRNELKGTMA